MSCKDVVLADKYAAVSDNLDQQNSTVKGIFASVFDNQVEGVSAEFSCFCLESEQRSKNVF